MAAQTEQVIFDEIMGHIKHEGSAFESWYAGITKDIEIRLQGYHCVPQKDPWYIWREAVSAPEAQNVQKALLEQGVDGIAGGDDDSSIFVYAYKKTLFTIP